MTVFVPELEEVIAATVENRTRLRLVVVEGVGGDGRAFEVGGVVEPRGDGLLAFAFVVVWALVVVVLGFLLGKSPGGRSAGRVVTRAEAQRAVADPFAVDGQGAGEGSQVGLEPAVEAIGQLVRIDSDEEITQGGVAGGFAEPGALLAREAQPAALVRVRNRLYRWMGARLSRPANMGKDYRQPRPPQPFRNLKRITVGNRRRAARTA